MPQRPSYAMLLPMTRSAPVFIVLSVLLSISACRRESDTSKQDHTADNLVIACREPGHLDPAYMVDRNDVGVVTNLCTGLFRPAPDGGTPRLGLARSWSCVDDGRRCIFEMDTEARWSDGAPVTASDLEWSWRRTAAPETGSPGAETLHVIQGMDACTRGEDCSPGIRVLGPYKLEMILEEPQPMLPYMLAHPRWCPVPKQAIEIHGDAWTAPEHYVGNGDYHLASWRRGVSLTMERQAGEDGPARVELRFTDSEDTALRWFEAGEVDIVDGLVPLDRVHALRRSRPGAVRSGPRCRTPPLSHTCS